MNFIEKCKDTGLAPTPDNQMAVIDGCDYVEQGNYIKDGKIWLVVKCEKCGNISKSWTKI